MAAPKNPLKLKRKTHFLAREHLRRFTDAQGMVHVCRKESGQVLSVKPDVDGLFNVNGVWSHGAEERMTRAENRFWSWLDAFEASPTSIDQEAVSEYFCTWRARVEFARSHREFEGPLVGITPSKLKGTVRVRGDRGEELDVTEEEILEFQNVGFYSEDVRASARSMSGGTIQWFKDYLDHLTREAKILWGVVEVPDAILVLPDHPTSFDIPISPHSFLHGFLEKDFSPVNTAPASVAEQLNRGHFDDAFNVVVSSSPDLLRALK